MPVVFGDQLADISDDEQELADFLATAREREASDDNVADNVVDNVVDGEVVDEFEADPEPGYSTSWREEIFGKKAEQPAGKKGKTSARVSAAVRRDIRAKVALMLTMGGSAWEVRDAHCGGAFVTAVPDTSEALADIFCESPAIVEWFSELGGFMKWIKLMTALQPVFSALIAHHVTHEISDQDAPGTTADWSAYSAGG